MQESQLEANPSDQSSAPPKARKTGHPGKKGQFQDLVGIMFQGLSPTVLTQVHSNLRDGLFNGTVAISVQRNHRVEDVTKMSQILAWLETNSNGPQSH